VRLADVPVDVLGRIKKQIAPVVRHERVWQSSQDA
jgi:hypothetical protein